MTRALTLAALVAGCGSAPTELATPPETTASPRDAGGSPRLSDVFAAATHNSYWVDHGVGDPAASGTSERLLDQLLADHVRAIELDVHRDDDVPHGFRVYHTSPGNSLCDPLDDCLAVLRAFHRALPQHAPLTIVVELKEITASNFDASHTIADLDAIFGEGLGGLLHRPADFLAPCDGHAEKTLRACAKDALWPSIAELRGKFLVTVLGNWDTIGAQATRDWADYATAGDVRERAAFPMASSWKLHATWPAPNVAQEEIDAAYEQSPFLQVESLDDPLAPAHLAEAGIVRIDNAFSDADAAKAIAMGEQLLQTDAPEAQYGDRGVEFPLRALHPGVADELLREPGGRLLVHPSDGARAFAYESEAPSGTTTWETTVSSGADATAVGCVRAAAALGAGAETSVMACRRKVSGRKPPAEGGGAGTPDAERSFVDVVACTNGACTTSSYGSTEPVAGGPGELLSVTVESRATGDSCVTVRSAREVDGALAPAWSDLGGPVCVPWPLPYQGLARPAVAGASAPVMFFGTTRDRGDGPAPVRGADFAGVAVEPEAGGAAGEDATRLEDRSAP